MPDSYERDPVSPLEAPAIGFQLEHRGHILDQWRPSLEAVEQKVAISQRTPVSTPAWAPPPLPPIPREKEQEAWRKRSLKRCSYASQLSNYTTEFPSDFENNHRRAVSVASISASVKSTPSRNFSRPTRWKEERSRSIDLNWKLASYNPQNWSTTKKWFHTIAASTVAFTCALASSIVPAGSTIDGKLQAYSIVRILPLALFAAGLAFGPTLNLLCSKVIGRKVTSIISMATFALVTLGSAFITTLYPFVGCRVAAAILASPALDASLMILVEVWSPESRQTPLASYSLLLLLGVTIGPVIGPSLVYFENRSWTQYVTLFAFVPCFILLACIRETHRDTLRRRTPSKDTFKVPASDRMMVLGRPFISLCTRPKVLLCTALGGLNFGTFYATFTSLPGIFAEYSNVKAASRRLSFIGMIFGVIVGSVILSLIHFLMQWMKRAKQARSDPMKTEKDRAIRAHSHTDSRASITPFRHTPSAMSHLGQVQQHTRQSSFRYLKADATLHDCDKNMDIAVAVANYLKDLSMNRGNRIEPERVLTVLEQSLAFDDLCLLLEGYDISFDRAALASVLAQTLPMATQEAGMVTKPLPVYDSRLSTPNGDDHIWPLPPHSPQIDSPRTAARSHFVRSSRDELASSRVPTFSPQNPLWTALSGCVLSTGALLMFGWTLNLKIPWIIPALALGIFACGGYLVFVSTTQYLLLSSNSTDVDHAVAASNMFRWIFAAAFSLFAVPLFNAMDATWATSVLGFINAGAVVLASILLALDKVSKRSARSSNVA